MSKSDSDKVKILIFFVDEAKAKKQKPYKRPRFLTDDSIGSLSDIPKVDDFFVSFLKKPTFFNHQNPSYLEQLLTWLTVNLILWLAFYLTLKALHDFSKELIEKWQNHRLYKLGIIKKKKGDDVIIFKTKKQTSRTKIYRTKIYKYKNKIIKPKKVIIFKKRKKKI